MKLLKELGELSGLKEKLAKCSELKERLVKIDQWREKAKTQLESYWPCHLWFVAG